MKSSEQLNEWGKNLRGTENSLIAHLEQLAIVGESHRQSERMYSATRTCRTRQSKFCGDNFLNMAATARDKIPDFQVLSQPSSTLEVM